MEEPLRVRKNRPPRCTVDDHASRSYFEVSAIAPRRRPGAPSASQAHLDLTKAGIDELLLGPGDGMERYPHGQLGSFLRGRDEVHTTGRDVDEL